MFINIFRDAVEALLIVITARSQHVIYRNSCPEIECRMLNEIFRNKTIL